MAAAEETGRPLRGVVHAAGVTGDGIVAALTQEGMERVWAPKVAGALRLHAATATRQLDWWVGFSSMASLLGLPGQLAYTTANAWLDALVAWRRASGLPATAIGWGQWSDVGMSRSLTYSVLDPITPGEGIEALESLVGGNLTRVGVGRMRLDRAIAAIPEFRELGYFERVVEEFDTSSVDDRSTVDDRDRSVAPVRDWSQIPAEDRFSELDDQAPSHPGPRTSNAGIGSRRGSAVPRIGTRLDDGDDGSKRDAAVSGYRLVGVDVVEPPHHLIVGGLLSGNACTTTSASRKTTPI